MAEWVLRERLASKGLGKSIWFKEMTAIGPCGTSVWAEAQHFLSEADARQHPAALHALTFYEPEQIAEEAL